ncbi:MAG: energy-coupling factor ABC transporter ATP-binding protein [Candidatus Bathyarchaeota archaeon]|nr:energy-coupling factor ABC transporter ATP-binding protein [Candidatus Bathyarchaeota archaeon]
MIEVRRVYFTYPGGVEALRNINLAIGKGELVAIMGENGAGKTTLIKMFNGLLKPTKGCVVVDGVDTKETSVAELSRKVGIVFQNPEHQLFAETIEDEIAFALRNFGLPEGEIARRIDSILKFTGLEKYRGLSPFTLSGGEKKRLALASILVFDPDYLVLDEPTIGQDPEQKDRLLDFLLEVNRRGKTIVMVTHDVEFVAECKPRVILMRRGEIIADGPAEKILVDEELMRSTSLLPPQISLFASKLNLHRSGYALLNVDDAFKILLNFLRDECLC